MLQVKKPTIALFLFPTFLFIALVNIFPIAYTIYISLTNENTFNEYLQTYHFVGLKNFQSILTEANTALIPVVFITLLYVALCIGSFLVIGMITAMILNDKRIRGLKIWRALIILPWAMPSFVTALIWKFLFDYNFGPFNNILRYITQNVNTGVNWLGSPIPAFIAVVVVNLWLSYPFFTIVILGALQSIPEELNDAAKVDGASPWQRFREVTLPLLVPAITPITVMSGITTFQMFNTVWLITAGGPFTDITKPGATDFVMLYFYNYFTTGAFTNYGKAAATAIIVFILLLIVILTGFRLTGFNREETAK